MSPPTTALPGRPRLADHALVRRHFVDGEEVIVVHDARSGDLVRMPPRAWALIEAADGTRDLGGLLLAASQRGVLLRASELWSVLTDLNAVGLLTDGIDPFALDPAPSVGDPDVPLDVLPFTLVCDGSGACCALYSTVRFTVEEAERARSIAPGIREGKARVFLPLAGSGAQPSRAATAIDGACSYLAVDQACEIHRAGGMAAKPAGCALYPATFVFDGEAVRVSLGVECACIVKSLGNKGGTPLVADSAKRRGDLPAGAQVAILPEMIDLCATKTAPRDAVVAWSRAVLRVLAASESAEKSDADGGSRAGAPEDMPTLLWSLAAAVDKGDLSEEGARAARAEAAPPDESALAPWAAALAERCAAKLSSAERWRGRSDRVLRESRALAAAASSFQEAQGRARALAGEGAPREVERFYVVSILFGHGLFGDVPLAAALRDRAVRMWLARLVPEAEGALATVEALMRAQGLKEYTKAVR